MSVETLATSAQAIIAIVFVPHAAHGAAVAIAVPARVVITEAVEVVAGVAEATMAIAVTEFAVTEFDVTEFAVMDLKQLEYFRHVAELGSFTRAASFLSVVQPALSRQVRQLEIELGQNLFERNGRGVVLTDAGSRLLEHTRGILTQIGRARQELEDQRNGDSGHFTLGLPPSLGSTVTVPLVKAFANSLPNARLATVEGLSAYILEWLNIGRVDCALVYNATESAQVHLQPLLQDQLYLIAPRTRKGNVKPVSFAELSELPLIIPSRPHAMRMVVENALAGVDHKICVAHEIECIPAVIDLVRQGHGFGVLPMNAVKSSQWARDVVAKPIGKPVLNISLSIATAAQRPRGPLVRKAVDLIRGIVRREIHSGEDLSAAANSTEMA